MKTLILILCLVSSYMTFASDTFTPEEQEILRKGELVKRVKWRAEYVWPEVTIYSIVPYSGIENLAVFTKYEDHKNFIPEMTKSNIVKNISPLEADVQFSMKVPWPVNSSTYTTKNIIKKLKENAYQLSWSLVEADYVKESNGSITFGEFEGKTLFTYTNQIVPNSSFAGLFKNQVEGDVEKSVREILSHLKRSLEHKDDTVSGKISELTSLL